MTALPVNEALKRIESELAEFWAAPDEESGTPMTKVRSSTMTYVIMTSQAEVERARETTEAVVETHPGRAFVLTVDGRLAPWEASHDVRMACRLDGGVQPICHDSIALTFGALTCERAGSIVAALALPEVPLVVEVGRGAPRTLVSALAPRADRLIVDTAHTSVTRVAEIAAMASSFVGDRQFVRTYTWRELVARFFDDALTALDDIRKVTVGRTPGGVTEPAALLLGWLGARLGWAFDSRQEARDRHGQTVEIVLQDEPHELLLPGELTGVWIETSVDGAPLSLACTRSKEHVNQVCWMRRGARESAHDYAMGHRGEDWVLVKAIHATEGDRVYREALTMAADWSGR
ncbi:MAG: glucose-6-phosphate dehydrogenase assembly protein OpcA [Polyangiaceae bacterium]|nr:glucose-6-phosphate dehydrogenase assembly protein OpcA [Polyangiaceae bacterium]